MDQRCAVTRWLVAGRSVTDCVVSSSGSVDYAGSGPVSESVVSDRTLGHRLRFYRNREFALKHSVY